ncbi:MAG TPA: SAM-dependent methyltransferase [Opitutaceae bacterium]|nr:SAM-dependent methyltransferase [Opitutaceae bacterium]
MERSHRGSHAKEIAAGDGDFRLVTPAGPGTFTRMLLICQAGFEALLVRELADASLSAVENGPGWVRVDKDASTERLAFPHLTLSSPVEMRGESVNALAQRVAEFFLTSLKGERIDASWPCVWRGPQEIVGLGRRISAVESAFGELLKKKLARVAKLASFDLPRGVGPARGLFVFFTDFGRAYVAREAFVHGQQRMADDDLAPSRSYLKVEEACIVLGREPAENETVCDLGAAPGGWSYSAAKRGAHVIAIDNGPLKGGALNHPRIEHRCEDAFKFAPRDGETFDWLFCDLVEEPHHVVQHLVAPWLSRGWCRNFVINLKFGRVDAIALLRELRAPDSPFSQHAPGTRIRHLYHDREEFTLVGEVATR